MWVGLSEFIIQDMQPTRLFSYLYDNPRCFTFKTEQVTFALKKSEESKIINLTRRFAETLVMVMYPEDIQAVNKNRSDCVNTFLKSIYSVCQNKNARIQEAMTYGDNPERFIQLTKLQLKDHHSYTKNFDGLSIILSIDHIAGELNEMRLRKVNWSPEWCYKLLDDTIEKYKNKN